MATDPALSAILAQDPRTLTEAIRGMIEGAARFALEGADASAMDEALKKFATTLAGKRAEAMMAGAESTIRAAERVARNAGADLPTIMASGELPAVAPTRAVEAILRRTPRLAKTSRQVAMMYQHDVADAFGAVKAARVEVLQKVQGAIAEGLKQGVPTPTVSDVVKDLGDWSRGYANTVTQTNLTSAYTDGAFAGARDPDVADLVVGMEIVGPTDEDARPNHKALVGFRAAVDDPRWATLRPPLGYNCRHSLRPVDRFRASRAGWLDANGDLRRMETPRGGHADPGFRPG